jgi:hypothetical protein
LRNRVFLVFSLVDRKHRALVVALAWINQGSKTGIRNPIFRLFGAILVDVAELLPRDGVFRIGAPQKLGSLKHAG